MCSDDRRARKEIYEVPGGDQVDGLPPVPVERCQPDGSGSRQELLPVAAQASQRLRRPDNWSGGVSGKLPRLPAREQARMKAFLPALRQRCWG
eukprot:5185830-Pyramimonas_sp.AAC.1